MRIGSSSVLAVAAVLLMSSQALAQNSATVNRFSASAAPTDDFQLDRPVAPGHLVFGGMVHFDYGLDPLVFEGTGPNGETDTATVIGHQLNANLALSLGLGDRVLVWAGLPVVMWMGGDDEPSIGGQPLPVTKDDPGLGDVYLGGRVVIYGSETDLFAVAAQLAVTFPSAGDQRFRGDEFLSLIPEALVSLRPGAGSRITANLGARIRESAAEASSNLSFGSEFTYGLGFAIPVWEAEQDRSHLDLHAQIYGTTTFNDLEGSPMEGVVGAKYFHGSGFIAGLAAGPGITRGFGSPVFRSILMLGYQMPKQVDSDGDGLLDKDDSCPDQPEDFDGWQDEEGCPDPDNDSDGVLDVTDGCPDDPEDKDGFQDDDGCVDPDNDGDGLPDVSDQCPDEPEDKDDFEDDNGCPDPDNDADGVLDVDDECPLEPGSADNKGCPDPDRDGDGVLDRVDNCPDEPGPAANQGCAEKQKVRIEGTSIEILEKVFFKSGKAVIQQRSFDLLDNVAQVVQAHPEITHVVVEGHTDSRGKRAYNVKLSQARAEAVMSYLISKGLVAERLSAKGFGPDRPIVDNARTKAEHAENRRVEFRIPLDASGVQPGDSNTPETD